MSILEQVAISTTKTAEIDELRLSLCVEKVISALNIHQLIIYPVNFAESNDVFFWNTIIPLTQLHTFKPGSCPVQSHSLLMAASLSERS